MGELEQQVMELEHEVNSIISKIKFLLAVCLNRKVTRAIFFQNQKLHLENQMLRERTSDLMTENKELRQRLGLDTLVRKEKVKRIRTQG